MSDSLLSSPSFYLMRKVRKLEENLVAILSCTQTVILSVVHELVTSKVLSKCEVAYIAER